MKLTELRQIIREEIDSLSSDPYAKAQQMMFNDKNKYTKFVSYLEDLGFEIEGPYTDTTGKKYTSGILSFYHKDKGRPQPKDKSIINQALEQAGYEGITAVVSPTFGFRVKAL